MRGVSLYGMIVALYGKIVLYVALYGIMGQMWISRLYGIIEPRAISHLGVMKSACQPPFVIGGGWGGGQSGRLSVVKSELKIVFLHIFYLCVFNETSFNAPIVLFNLFGIHATSPLGSKGSSRNVNRSRPTCAIFLFSVVFLQCAQTDQTTRA